MKVEGSCHCGRISYEAEIDPEKVSICHCTDCQQLTGSAFRVNVPTPDSDFHLISGTPKIYVKIAESGRQRAQAFCGDCGSPIYATSVGEGPKVLGLRTGAMRQRTELVPRRQIWCRSALEWLPDIPSIEAVQRD